MKPRVLLSMVLFMLSFTLALTGCSKGSDAVGNKNNVPVQRQLTPRNQNLVNGIISVSAANYYNSTFTVNSTMQRATVTGSFSASAALGDNIEVYILSDLAYTNWSHGSSPPSGTFYNSGRITTDNINVSLGPGTYHLVLSNTYSTFSTKQVTTNINLNWVE